MPLLRRLLGLITGSLSFVFLIFVLNPIQIVSVTILPFSRRTVRAINRWCARSIWGLWVLMAERQNRIEIRLTGDPLPVGENALLLPNHQSMTDVMALLCLAWRCGRVGDMKWFCKDVIKWFPGFGWGMWLLDCIFVKRDWERDREGIRRLFDKYRAEGIPLFLVSFLEGTRFRTEKLPAARRFAQERGLYCPSRTLVPRTKGFVATMEGLRDHLDAVYDVTIGYPDGVPSLPQAFQAMTDRVEIHVRRHPVEGLPTDPEGLAAWAHEAFRAKDERMAELARDGRFSGPDRSEPIRWLDWFRVLPRAAQQG